MTDQQDDLAPDADEPGDDTLDGETKDLIEKQQDEEVKQDNVDKEG